MSIKVIEQVEYLEHLKHFKITVNETFPGSSVKRDKRQDCVDVKEKPCD